MLGATTFLRPPGADWLVGARVFQPPQACPFWLSPISFHANRVHHWRESIRIRIKETIRRHWCLRARSDCFVIAAGSWLPLFSNQPPKPSRSTRLEANDINLGLCESLASRPMPPLHSLLSLSPSLDERALLSNSNNNYYYYYSQQNYNLLPNQRCIPSASALAPLPATTGHIAHAKNNTLSL